MSIEGHRLVEGVGAHGDPFHALQIVGHIGPQLGDGHEIVAVDAEGAVHSPAGQVAVTVVGVVLRALIIGRKHVFHVFHGDLVLGHHAPR